MPGKNAHSRSGQGLFAQERENWNVQRELKRSGLSWQQPDDAIPRSTTMRGKIMKKEIGRFAKILLCMGLVAALGVVSRAQAHGSGPKFVVDPSWPKPLPEKWVTGQVSGVCVDAQDNVFIVNRNDKIGRASCRERV